MTTTSERRRGDLGEEARRYLEVVDSFAALGTDPHAAARARANRARADEDRTTQASGRKAVFRWRS
jgi:hypothetical protein